MVLFIAIKGINKLKTADAPAPPAGPTPEVKLLTEIRDLLKK
jgi:large conductance mechanosensitive channel